MTAADILAEASKIYAERNKVYGDNYLRVGKALEAMFPDGLNLSSDQDHNRFQIFNLIFVKLSRYAVNWEKGGHKDSIHDATVYCAMLEAIDDDCKEYWQAFREKEKSTGQEIQENLIVKLTSKELQDKGDEIARHGGYVSIITPAHEKIFVELQEPFILTKPLPLFAEGEREDERVG